MAQPPQPSSRTAQPQTPRPLLAPSPSGRMTSRFSSLRSLGRSSLGGAPSWLQTDHMSEVLIHPYLCTFDDRKLEADYRREQHEGPGVFMIKVGTVIAVALAGVALLLPKANEFTYSMAAILAGYCVPLRIGTALPSTQAFVSQHAGSFVYFGLIIVTLWNGLGSIFADEECITREMTQDLLMMMALGLVAPVITQLQFVGMAMLLFTIQLVGRHVIEIDEPILVNVLYDILFVILFSILNGYSQQFRRLAFVHRLRLEEEHINIRIRHVERPLINNVVMGWLVDRWNSSSSGTQTKVEPLARNSSRAYSSRLALNTPRVSDHDTQRPASRQRMPWEVDSSTLEWHECLGRGAHGEVFRARWRNSNVAVKKMSVDTLKAQRRIEDFMAECTLLAELRHRNIVMFVGVAVEPDNILLLTEFMEFGSLFSILHVKRAASLSLQSRTDILLQAARGLGYLHAYEPAIIHMDLKSENILVDSHWTAKLSDFGMASPVVMQDTDAHSQGSSAGPLNGPGKDDPDLPGTVSYLAPEVILDNKYSTKADIFSFGIIMWEVFCNQIPHLDAIADLTAVGLMACVAGEQQLRPSMDSMPHLVGNQIRSLMTACWDEDPYMRPACSEIVGVIEAGLPSNNVDAARGLELVAEDEEMVVAVVRVFVSNFAALWESNPYAMQAGVSLMVDTVRRLVTKYRGVEISMDMGVHELVFDTHKSAADFAADLHMTLLDLPWSDEVLALPQAAEVRNDRGQVLFRGLRASVVIHWTDMLGVYDAQLLRVTYTGRGFDVVKRMSRYAREGSTLVCPSFCQGLDDDLLESSVVLPVGHGMGAPSRVTAWRRGLAAIFPSEDRAPCRELLPAALQDRFGPVPVSAPQDEQVEQDGIVPGQMPSTSPADVLSNASGDKTTATVSPTDTAHGTVATVATVATAQLPDKGDVDQEEIFLNRLREFGWLLDFEELDLHDRLGTGSFGTVFRGVYKGDTVAIKKLHQQNMDDETRLSFITEACIMASLAHPNVVRFIGGCTERPNVCLVNEYCLGDLQHLLRRRSDDLPSIKQMLTDVVTGMAYIHGQRILHRDLKAANVLLGQDHRLKIGDFGLARIRSISHTMTRCGTIQSMAPEVLMGKQYSYAADVFAFGVLVWEIYTHGLTPWHGMNGKQVSRRVVQGERLVLPSTCARQLHELVDECWDGNPDARPQFAVLHPRLMQLPL